MKSTRPEPPGPAGPAPDPVRTPWEPAMRQALAEAQRAGRGGDVPVGAVVLDPDGRLLSAAHNEREADGDPTGGPGDARPRPRPPPPGAAGAGPPPHRL
ncbi:hypothetical protein ACFW0U_30365, partial [Streptomyces albidoflavus]